MKNFINRMEMHTKSVLLGVRFAIEAMRFKVMGLFINGNELKIMDKCIKYFEKGHVLMSNFYGECVEKGVDCYPGILDLIDQYNEYLWELKQTREDLIDHSNVWFNNEYLKGRA